MNSAVLGMKTVGLIYFACLTRSDWIVNVFVVLGLGPFASTSGDIL
jgi:hypothetical protein